MRCPCFLLVLLAGIFQLVSAQGSNRIVVPPNGFQVIAGQPTTIEWTNPSPRTVTIQLVPASGAGNIVTLTSTLQNTGIATLVIPSDIPTTQQYQFKITDDSNSSNVHLSPAFRIFPPIDGLSSTSSFGVPSATTPATTFPESFPTSSDSSLSTGAIVGASVGGVLGIIALLGIAIFFFWRHRKHKSWMQRQQHQQQQQASGLPHGDPAPSYDMDHPYSTMPSQMTTQMVGRPEDTKKWMAAGADGQRLVQELSEVSGSRSWPRELEGTSGFQHIVAAELPADPVGRNVGGGNR